MKNNLVLLILIALMFITNTINVNATSGALQKDSIKTCPNGIKYGYHNSKEIGRHWHKAESHPKMSSGWAAVGDPIMKDPCPKSSEAKPSQGSNSNNSSSNQNQAKPTPSPVVKKSNETGISILTINDKHFYSVTDTTNHTIETDKLEIKVELKDKKATYQINGLEIKPEKDKTTKYEIIVTAEDGTKKIYTINIYRKIVDSYVRIRSLKINGSNVYLNSSNPEEITLLNDEDKLNIEYELTNDEAKLLIIKDSVEVKNGSKINVGKTDYQLKIVDSDGNEYSYNVVIERMSAFDETVGSILGVATLAGGGYLAYRMTNKKKK